MNIFNSFCCARRPFMIFLSVGMFICISAVAVAFAYTAKVAVAETQIEHFVRMLSLYRSDTGAYPTTEEGLIYLREKPNNINNWRGPYINKIIPLDPWHKPYIYISPAKYGTKEYDLYSFGKNGRNDYGQQDDITNWQPINKTYYPELQNGAKQFWPIVVVLFLSLLFLVLRRRKVH